MLTQGLLRTLGSLMMMVCFAVPGVRAADVPPASRARVEAAIGNMMALDRPHQTGIATIWDGNKAIQCRRTADTLLRCEAAGTAMQPTLRYVLQPGRLARLEALGWRLDPSFGSYAQVFPSNLAAKDVADRILQALGVGYDADLVNLEARSSWIASAKCPARNGQRQDWAGLINDTPATASYAIHTCSYAPPPPPSINRPPT